MLHVFISFRNELAVSCQKQGQWEQRNKYKGEGKFFVKVVSRARVTLVQ